MSDTTAICHQVKTPENTLYQRLIEDIGLNQAQADKAIELILDWNQSLAPEARGPGQIVYTAVCVGEPAGKPLRCCRTKQVHLTMMHRGDGRIKGREGSKALRRARLFRWTWEACEQGALLSQQDLAVLSVQDISSIKRQVADLRALGFVVPTRGWVEDIGRAPSHKECIGRLLCRGYVFTDISALTGHSESSIERYALDLGKVIALADEGALRNQIRVVCDLSEAAIDCYLGLYEAHNTDEFRLHLDKLKQRYQSGKGVVGPGQYPSKRPVSKPYDKTAERTYALAVSRELQQSLDLTSVIADHVASRIDHLHEKLFADNERLQYGQTVVLVETADSAPKYSGQHNAERLLVPVVLSPWTPDKIDILRSDKTASEKRAEIADGLAREARQQGGTITIELLSLLVGCSPAVISNDLARQRVKQEEPTPIKGITEDAGATLTHKEPICDLLDAGYTPPEISRITCHEPESRDRYLKTMIRLETLVEVLKCIPDEVQAARFLGQRRSVVTQYIRRLEKKLAKEQHSNDERAA